MVEVITGKDITIAKLKTTYGLQRTEDENFFTEWQENLPEISEWDKQYLDEVKQDFLYLSEYPMLEPLVKMTVLSPLLRRAGFFRPPFYLAAEKQVEIVSEDEGTIVRGLIDILVIKPELWTVSIEAKQGNYALSVALPQALFYMLANPNTDKPAFGFITNGKEFQFLKLVKEETPKYAWANLFSIYNPGDLYVVVKIFKRLGQIISQ